MVNGRGRRCVSAVLTCVLLLGGRAAGAHRVYLANDNHTDYGWNATTDTYDTGMAGEIDFYLAQIAATADNPPAEQARFNADCWWYLYLYEHNRTPEQFHTLIEAMRSGHITVPLNPFVQLYGALPTEAAIRAGYYPGRMQRQYDLPFLLAADIENATIPWGLATIWGGSDVKYSWKGICECLHGAPYADREEEVFRWLGPDNSELLMKWYQASGGGSGQTWGGYAEARANLSQDAIRAAIDRFSNRTPFVPFTGLFGAGWDDVTHTVGTFVTTAEQWNAAHPGGDQVIVSNEIDYFLELEQYRDMLPQLRGGWGNDWDLWTAALTARTSQARGAIERLRGAEALAAIVHWADPSLWATHQPLLESGLVSVFKYFEHTWGAFGPVSLSSVIANKKAWAQDITNRVVALETEATTRLTTLFDTPDENRVAIFNPLGFERTDYADLPVATDGPYVVTDVATGAEVPNQVVSLNGERRLRWLASYVPSLGYRVYRYAVGTPTAQPDAATITGSTIENARYSVTLGSRGEIASLLDLSAAQELVAPVFNDFGSGTAGPPHAQNVGPVSATISVDVAGPPARRVHVTLLREVDRIEIENEILNNVTADSFYDFQLNLTAPTIHFEEVGAIAQPGLVADGGSFLPGARADYMTLNHFVALATDQYHVLLSDWDAIMMRIGDSTATAFDLDSSRVQVLAVGNPANSKIRTQGGDDYFRHRFAVRGSAEPFSAAAAMRMSLAHQNPLRAVLLPRNNDGPFCAPVHSFLSIDAPNVVVTAFKPAEDVGAGMVVRLWELEGVATDVTIDAASFSPCTAQAVSLVETDTGPLPLAAGTFSTTIGANQIAAYRFVHTPVGAAGCTDPPSPPTNGCTVCASTADCADDDPCTSDSCTATGLCHHEPVDGCTSCLTDGDCDDGDACTDPDTCRDGMCIVGPPPDCVDGNMCTDDDCDPLSGCTHGFKTEPCDDGEGCTTADGCNLGVCAGTPRSAATCASLGDADCDGHAATPIDAQVILCLESGRCTSTDLPASCSGAPGERSDWNLDGLLTSADAVTTLGIFVGAADPSDPPLSSCCTELE